MLVLLSIRPEHVANILGGRKIFEYRRRLYARRDIRKALIYCTKPVGRFVAEFDIEGVLADTPDRLWRKTKTGAGISKKYFDQYFNGRNEAFALQIGEVRRMAKEIVPSEVFNNFTPPQSFMYISSAALSSRRHVNNC